MQLFSRFKRKETLKDRPEFRKMRVQGHNKLYFVLKKITMERFQSVITWLTSDSYNGFAVQFSPGGVFVIVAKDAGFNPGEVKAFLLTLVSGSQLSTSDVEFEIYKKLRFLDEIIHENLTPEKTLYGWGSSKPFIKKDVEKFVNSIDRRDPEVQVKYRIVGPN